MLYNAERNLLTLQKTYTSKLVGTLLFNCSRYNLFPNLCSKKLRVRIIISTATRKSIEHNFANTYDQIVVQLLYVFLDFKVLLSK